MMASDMWDLDKKFYDINNLPNTKNEWLSIINTKYRMIYRNELSEFITNKNGRILNLITGMDTILAEYNTKIYSGLFDIIESIYGVDISSNNLIKTIKILFNWTKFNFLTMVPDTNSNTMKITNLGLIWIKYVLYANAGDQQPIFS